MPVGIAVQVAWWVWACVAVYGALGLVFAVAFVLHGAARVDHAAKGSRWTFRLMILPGATALWPLLLMKWVRADKGVEEHS